VPGRARLRWQVGALSLLALVAGQSVPAGRVDGELSPSSRGVAIALLADASIFRVSLSRSAVLGRRGLVSHARIGYVGRQLVLSRDGKRVYALVPSAEGGRQQIVALETRTLRLRGRWTLPAGATFRVLDLGRKTGVVYAFGNLAGEAGAASAVLAVLDPRRGEPATQQTLREAGGHNWEVFDAAVNGDENRLVASYHGGCQPPAVSLCTTGRMSSS
jgi:hypothetical protein